MGWGVPPNPSVGPALRSALSSLSAPRPSGTLRSLADHDFERERTSDLRLRPRRNRGDRSRTCRLMLPKHPSHPETSPLYGSRGPRLTEVAGAGWACRVQGTQCAAGAGGCGWACTAGCCSTWRPRERRAIPMSRMSMSDTMTATSRGRQDKVERKSIRTVRRVVRAALAPSAFRPGSRRRFSE